MRSLINRSILSIALTLAGAAPMWGQPSSDTVGGVLGRQQDVERSREVESRIRMQRSKPEEQKVPVTAPAPQGPQVLIRDIRVEGADLLKASDIEIILAAHRGKEQSMADIQTVADEITALYRRQGYVTSRAYIPPQNLNDGQLLIKVIEGRMGDLEIKGNKYFNKNVYARYFKLSSQDMFDYAELQRALGYINEHPDRQVKATLLPGKQTGLTDVMLEAYERAPVHVGFEFDNWASRYLNNYRYAVTFEHNNITGHDDRALFKFQTTDGVNLKLYQGRYLYPLSRKAQVGVHGQTTETELAKEFRDLDAHGKGQIYGIFYNYELYKDHDLELHLNLGYDYKDIKNFLLGQEISRDRLSILKAGFDVDVLDNFGRNIFLAELDAGIPDFAGSMKSKDPHASRAGAGAQFQKWLLSYYRLQPMPFETHILLKNTAQVSNHALVSGEQFQIGGPTSVRGYAPGEYSGDKGFYSGIDWSVPVYGLPKKWKVPMRKESLYDSLRLVAFYDIGYVNTKNLSAGEKEDHTLKGYGYGIRLNPNQDFEIRFEMGFPIGDKSTDGKHAHPWVEARYKF